MTSTEQPQSSPMIPAPSRWARAKREQLRRAIPARRILISVLGASIIIQPLLAIAPALPGAAKLLSPIGIAAAASSSNLNVTSQAMITSGAQRIDYLWTGIRSGKSAQANVHVIKVDLTNPYVKLNALNGTKGVITDRSSVLTMTKNAGAVAGINADFFQTASSDGAPLGQK